MGFGMQCEEPSPSGARLNLYVREADGRPRGVIQVNHGVAEHAGRYARFADALAAHGFHTYAHDHRGHGRSRAPDAPRGHFGSGRAADKVLEDVAAVHDRIARDHPGLPVVVFGHSMGGLIALCFVLRHPERAAAAAIWNANFAAGLAGHAARAVLAWERFRIGSDAVSHVLPRLTMRAWARQFPERRTDFDWLSRDPAEVDEYMSDPLCGFDVTVGTWSAIFDFIFEGADDRNFALLPKAMPFNLVGGEKDPATGGGRAVEALAGRMRRMGFSNLVSTVYPQTRHESLNEVNRNIITADFAAWAEKAVG